MVCRSPVVFLLQFFRSGGCAWAEVRNLRGNEQAGGCLSMKSKVVELSHTEVFVYESEI